MSDSRLERVISPDGTFIGCWVSGEGPPLVLLHGTTGDHNSYVMLAPLLQGRFTLWIPDRRGRGESGDAGPYAIEREFEDVSAVLRKVDEPAFLFGHSFGADVAAGAALESPEAVKKLVLYDPVLGRDAPTQDQLAQLDALNASGDRDRLLEVVMREVSGMSEEQIEIFRATPFWDVRRAAIHTTPRELRAESVLELDLAGSEALAAVPLLLLLGSESPEWAGLAVGAAFAALPHAVVKVLEGQGHSANMTAPDVLAAAMVEFLGG